jgi:Sulfotransferase family
MTDQPSSRALVVGVPRSGTTWVATVLARGAGAVYLGEPDNHLRFAYAFRAKRSAGQRQYPSLAPGLAGEKADALARLWECAFAPSPRGRVAAFRRRSANRLLTLAGRRTILRVLGGSPERSPVLAAAVVLAVPERPAASDGSLVVKSVYAPLTVEWIAGRNDARIVVVLRHPRNVISSWLELGWIRTRGSDPVTTAFKPSVARELADRFGTPVPESSRLARSTWIVGVLTCALEEACRRNPSWVRVVHEELCTRPTEEFPLVAARAGLGWSEAGDMLLSETNRPGHGYEPARVSAEMPDAWRTRLGASELREIDAVLERLPLESWQ